MFDLGGKVAVITGGGQGIGAAVWWALASHGAVVYNLDLDRERAEDVASAIAATGGHCEAFQCDVGDQENVRAVFSAVSQQSGALNIVVNNAGVAHVGTVETTSEEELDRVYRVNVKGVYNGMNAAIPHMKASGGGSIINILSIVSDRGIPDRFAYTMSKGAVSAMTRSVAVDYLHAGIRCNCVLPARIHTPFVDGYLQKYYPDTRTEMLDALSSAQPIGRMGRPEEVATLVVYLASDASNFLTGASLPVDGGFLTLHP